MNYKRNFKPGDKVYYPAKSNRIYTVRDRKKDGDFPFEVDGYSFTVDGKRQSTDFMPSIFLATDDNRHQLQDLTGSWFEIPLKVPTNADIIKEMLERGDKYVMCYVSDTCEVPDHCCKPRVIDGYDPDSPFPFTVKDEPGWKYATPIDNRGNPITKL